MGKEGQTGRQDSVSQHTWQQSQHNAALLLPRGLWASQQSHILGGSQKRGNEAGDEELVPVSLLQTQLLTEVTAGPRARCRDGLW